MMYGLLLISIGVSPHLVNRGLIERTYTMIWTALFLALLAQAEAKPQTGYHADGSDVEEYIVNGQDVTKGRYPWMLSLEVLDPEFRHTCGASLLDSRHALTAAHCLDGRHPEMSFRVRVGCSNMGGDTDCEDTVNVTGAVLHEEYDCGTCPGAFPNDIAVMYLGTEVVMNEFVQGAVLGAANTSYTGRTCFSSGWGKLLGTDEGVPEQLQEIEIDVLSLDDCRDNMPLGGTINVQPDVHLCIFDQRDVTDDQKRGICQGDSGGPVQCDVDGEWHMLGAASWVIAGPGIGSTCNPAFPGVYADATNYLGWIQEKIDDPSWKPDP